MKTIRECMGCVGWLAFVLALVPTVAAADAVERKHYSGGTYDSKHKVLADNGVSYAYALEQALETRKISEVRTTRGKVVEVLKQETFQSSLSSLPLPMLVAGWVWSSSPKTVGAELDILVREPEGELYPVTIRHDLGKRIEIKMGEPHKLGCRAEEVSSLSAEAEAKRLGVRSYRSSKRSWTQEELCLVGQGVTLLSVRERDVLAELDVVRQPYADAGTEEADEEHKHGAHFVLDSEIRGLAQIRIYDVAFARRLTKMVGSVERFYGYSAYVFMHEVGHALSMWPRMRRYAEHERAMAKFDGVKSVYEQAYERYQRAHAQFKAATLRMVELDGNYRREWTAYNTAVDRYNGMVDVVKAERDRGVESTLTKGDLDAAEARITVAHKVMKVAEAGREEADKPMAKLHQAVGDAKRVVDEQGVDYNALQAHIKATTIDEPSALLGSYQGLLRKGDWPTLYGATSLDESFAESFALYKTDPEALKRVLPKVLAWFEAGGHLVHLPKPLKDD